VWGDAYLKHVYHVNNKFNDNHKDVRNYYRDKIDHVICNFGAHANLRHDKSIRTNYMPFVHCENQSLPLWFSFMQVSIYEGHWMTLWNKSLN